MAHRSNGSDVVALGRKSTWTGNSMRMSWPPWPLGGVVVRVTGSLKCLLAATAPYFRHREGLDRLLIPYSPELAMPGYTIHGWRPDAPEMEWPENGKYLWLRFGPRGKATEFTFYGRASFEEIISSFESPDGAPLFTDVRRVPASSSEHARP